MSDTILVERAKALISRHGKTWRDSRTGCDYSTIEVETPDSPPSTLISLNESDDCLTIVEDGLVIFRFDQLGRLTSGDEQKALPFLARLLDCFEQGQKD